MKICDASYCLLRSLIEELFSYCHGLEIPKMQPNTKDSYKNRDDDSIASFIELRLINFSNILCMLFL